jgi:membrane associated rhomboid family serine protease
MDAETPSQAPPPIIAKELPKRQAWPIMTLLACAACVIVFFGINGEPNPYSWEALSKWGVYPEQRLRGGAYWGFVSSVFVHIELWHLAFNLYWLYVFGSRLERAIGSGLWLAFFLGAAIVSSGSEFAFSDSTGMGASGVGYAMFGFLWITREHFPTFKAVLTARIIGLFFLWLVGCWITTLAKIQGVGNAAHVAGLLFGVACGAWVVHRPQRALLTIAICSLLVVAVIPLFWAPWSFEWTSGRAVRAHERGDYATAIHWYQRSMELGQDKSWCWQNIALAYYSQGDKTNCEDALRVLHKLDEPAAEKIEAEIKTK